MISRERAGRRKFPLTVAAAGLFFASPSWADPPPEAPPPERSVRTLFGAPPPQSLPPASVNNPFIQFGVGFTTEFVAASNALCSPNSKVVPQCILGSGAGLVFPRVGWRSPGNWYIGGAYEFSKQDASTVYLLPILQQLRGEVRYYFLQGYVGTPFVEADLGVVGYGNEWAVDSYGPAASAVFGVEAQISRNTVVGVTLAYRSMHLSGFTDTAGDARNAGYAQVLGLNVMLEARDPY